jgi:A/G-specific adenine glycosylase
LHSFSARVVTWQKRAGRQDLPWQGTRDPYLIWLSEIMLQQTQVNAVVPYFYRFIESFPTLEKLAAAPQQSVMAQWSGLGYYARARNLHRAAQVVVNEHGGIFPKTPDQIARLPGIGRSTANAIAAFAFGVNAPILDGNVKRVLARHGGIEGDVSRSAIADVLWDEAYARQPKRPSYETIARYTQGVMDLGAQVCIRGTPKCDRCPISSDCVAHHTGRERLLPSPRAKKIIPSKSLSLALIVEHDRVLVEKRPPRGIWGGLMSLPEFEGDLRLWAQAALQRPAEQTVVETLPTIEHQLTHFRLLLKPARASFCNSGLGGLVEPPFVWLPFLEIAGAALPAPIKRFLLSLYSAEPS